MEPDLQLLHGAVPISTAWECESEELLPWRGLAARLVVGRKENWASQWWVNGSTRMFTTCRWRGRRASPIDGVPRKSRTVVQPLMFWEPHPGADAAVVQLLPKQRFGKAAWAPTLTGGETTRWHGQPKVRERNPGAPKPWRRCAGCVLAQTSFPFVGSSRLCNGCTVRWQGWVRGWASPAGVTDEGSIGAFLSWWTLRSSDEQKISPEFTSCISSLRRARCCHLCFEKIQIHLDSLLSSFLRGWRKIWCWSCQFLSIPLPMFKLSNVSVELV